MSINAKILEQYQAFWIGARDTHDFGAMAQVLRGMLHFFGNDITQCDLIEEMADLIDTWLPLMELEDFTRCAKATMYARTKISTTRGIRYASGLSRKLTESEFNLVRSAGFENHRSRPEGDNNGDEGVRGFVGDIRADGDDGE